MKCRICTIFICFLSLAPLSAKDKASVVEIYQSLPLEAFAHQGTTHRYSLDPLGNKWKTKSTAGYPMDAVVDSENGYLEIVDRGTGGGFVTHELAVLDSKARGRVVILNIFAGNDTRASSAGLKIFVRQGTNWKDVTAEVFPGINWTMFYQPNQWNMEELKQAVALAKREKIELVRYKLPRIGTSLRASFLRENIIIRGQYAAEGLTAEESRLLLSLANTLARSRIMLKWNREKGVFELPD